MALSYHERASSLFPVWQWAIARKNQSWGEPPEVSSIDLDRALMDSSQAPARYCATPSVFQIAPALGACSTAILASSTARTGSRSTASGAVARNQARLLWIP